MLVCEIFHAARTLQQSAPPDLAPQMANPICRPFNGVLLTYAQEGEWSHLASELSLV
jgi:hypothetical protein